MNVYAHELLYIQIIKKSENILEKLLSKLTCMI